MASAKYAGPSVILSFLISGIVAILAALSFSELATMMSHSGAAYTYTYAGQLSMLYLFCLYQCGFFNYFSHGRYLLNRKYPKDGLFCYYL